jgi:hypothetical protein
MPICTILSPSARWDFVKEGGSLMDRRSMVAAGLLAAGVLVLGLFLFSRQEGPKRLSADETSGSITYHNTLQEWVDMWNRKDLSFVDRVFLTDGRVSYYSSERPGLIRGIDALREHHRGFGFVPGGKEITSELRLSDVESAAFGPVSIVTATWYFIRGESETETVQRGPVTFVFVREEDHLRIAHAHFADQPMTET